MFWPRFNLETLVVALLKFPFDPTQATLDEDLGTDEEGRGKKTLPAGRDRAGAFLRNITAAFVLN